MLHPDHRPPPLRFSRSLLQAGTDLIPSYLIPTSQGIICSDSSCCNADYAASPFRLAHLNSSLVAVGGEMVTTFYMALSSNSVSCIQNSGNNPCCTSNVSKIWVDVGESWGLRNGWEMKYKGWQKPCPEKPSTDG